jgi:hypothetical protein
VTFALLAAVSLLACAALGCGGTRPEPRPRPAETPATPLHEGPLTDFVAAAGLRWMVVGRPAEIAGLSDLAPILGRIVPAERLDAYAHATGVDLRTTPSALVAGFDLATLYVGETTNTSVVRRRFVERHVAGETVRVTHPRVELISGVVGQTPETLVVVRDRLVGVAVGDPTPARVVDAFARGRLRRSPRALEGSALSTLPSELAKAPLRFYAPGPFADEWQRGARGLLSSAFAVGCAAQPVGDGVIEAHLVLAGDLRATPDAKAAFAAAWEDLAQSSTGRLLGLHRPAGDPTVSEVGDTVRLRVRLELGPIVDGLRAATMADVWEILDLKPR